MGGINLWEFQFSKISFVVKRIFYMEEENITRKIASTANENNFMQNVSKSILF